MGNGLGLAGGSASRAALKAGQSLGVEPFTRAVAVVRKGAQWEAPTYTEIEPTPHVELVDSRKAKAFRSAGELDIEVGDYSIYVPKSYAIEDIAGDGVTYLIDAKMDESPPTGIEAYLVPERVLDASENFWELLVRQQV